MLPVSGAEQLKASGDHSTRPITSQTGAYSRFVRPAPDVDSGRNRFHKPWARACCFNSSISGSGAQRSPAATSCAWRFSFG